MTWLASLVVRRRWWVIGAWLLIAGILVPNAGRLERELEVAARIPGSEAVAVQEMLASRFSSPFAHFAVLVVTGVPAPNTAAGESVLRRLTTTLDTTAGVASTLSWLGTADTLFVPADHRGTFLVVGLEPGDGQLDALVAPLRAVTGEIADDLRPSHPDIALRWTGEVPINFDLRQTSAADARDAERRVLPLTVILLLLAFGAIVAALLPVVAATLAILIALGAAVLIDSVWPLALLLQNVVSMIGLGVGIDYALLTVSRFRESLAAGRSAEAAAIDAARHAGVTIALSGLAVVIGFGALLLVPLNELQAVGVGGMLVVAISVAMATTLLPAALAVLGPRINRGGLWSQGPGHWAEARWRAWGRWVVARPRLVLLTCGLPVAALAWQARHLESELPRGKWLPTGMESARGVDDLDRMHRSGVINTIRVLLELPAGQSALEPTGWTAIQRLSAAIAADPRVAHVQSLPGALRSEQPNPVLLSLVPDVARRSMISADERIALLDVVPHDGVSFNALSALARELRLVDATKAVGISGAAIHVGGLPAFNADYVDVINSRFPQVASLVVLLTLAVLMIGFRSVLVPVKALALNLLSVCASFGAVVLVFQKGYGGALLGVGEPLGAVFPAVPILVFCTVFGLSMDYEVFLVARIAEARRTMSDDDAIAEGLARTGGVITSAAAIMIAVFGAFTLGQFLFIKVLGFALATAVFLDATVVRMAIGPALLKLAGHWNWWPGDGADRRALEPTGRYRRPDPIAADARDASTAR
jgi:RND superfamily putative drug exporter